jgi:5-methylcytosine-specific restriction protein A
MAFVKDGTPFLNYGPHMRLQMNKKLNGLELSLSDLKKRGLRGNIQGPRTVSGELLEYIESVIDRNSV